MRQIKKDKIQIGQTIQIEKDLINEVSEFLNKKDVLLGFKVTEKMENMNNNEDFFICEANFMDNEKNEKLLLSENVIRYLTGIKVRNDNRGYILKNFFPEKGEKIIIADKEECLKIYPYQFLLKACTIQSMLCLQFVFQNLLNFSEAPFFMYSENSWKVLDASDVYMNDVEKMYQDTFVHKEYVSKTCNTFADYLQKIGKTEEAEDLRHRAVLHDNSKILNEDEFKSLTSIINDKSCLTDANSKLSKFKQDAIKLHWKNNEHHPEHYENISEMPYIARVEFVCDCCARSIQYKTNLVKFMETRLRDRFEFSETIKEEILNNCRILLKLLGK